MLFTKFNQFIDLRLKYQELNTNKQSIISDLILFTSSAFLSIRSIAKGTEDMLSLKKYSKLLHDKQNSFINHFLVIPT